MHACDLADRSAVEGLLATIGQVDAVVHAAGVAEDAALVDADEAHLRRVVAGKVDGALHLDALVGEVDAFVVFSSISGIWGSAEQAAYGAANAALDALIARRRASGLPGTAVAWGPWAQVGMAADDETAAQLRRRGLTPIEPGPALAALAGAVGAGEESVTVADVRWAEFLPLFTASRARPFLLISLPEASVPAAAPESGSGLAERLAGLAPAERTRSVLELVRAQVAAVLGHASAGAVEPDRAFKELGFDSLTAVELRNRLQAATGLALPATLVFDYPSAERLAAFRAGQVVGADASVGGCADAAVVADRRRSDRDRRDGRAAARWGGDARGSSGTWSPRVETGSGRSRPIGVGIWRGFITRTRITLGRSMPVRVGSCMARVSLMRGCSGFRRVRRWRWIRSSGCCWRPRGRRSRRPGSARSVCGASRSVCSSALSFMGYGIGPVESAGRASRGTC